MLRDRRIGEPDAAQDEPRQLGHHLVRAATVGIGVPPAEPAERRHRRGVVGEPEGVGGVAGPRAQVAGLAGGARSSP